VTTLNYQSLAVGIILAFAGCSERAAPKPFTGDAGRGAALIREYGCGSCHVIPQIENAHGKVGPPLGGYRDRAYVAGTLVNDENSLARWIREPSVVNPGTAMPAVGLSEAEARDVVAYLYTH
jgi:cytochrome c